MAGDTMFGFNTTQKKTLERLLASDDAALSMLAQAVASLQDSLGDLQDDLTDLQEDLTDLEEATQDAVDLVAGIPTTDPADGVGVWNDEGTLKVPTGP